MSEPFYFKYIEIPYDQTEISNFFNSRPANNSSRFEVFKPSEVLAILPSISNWFNSQNLVPLMVAYIAIGGNSNQKIHTDSGPPSIAINIPVCNCETVKTYFYEVDISTSVNFNTKDTKYPAVEYEGEKTEVCSYILNKPALINIKAPHGIRNHTDNTRYALSFRFQQDPVHLL